VENSKSNNEFPTLPSALGNPAKNQTPDSHIPTAPAATGNIFKLQDEWVKVTFLNCLTGYAVCAGCTTEKWEVDVRRGVGLLSVSLRCLQNRRTK